jgi:hypothetical protein
MLGNRHDVGARYLSGVLVETGTVGVNLMLYLKNLNLVINGGVQINVVRTNTSGDTQLQIFRL